ncbi:MAG: patatin-like phospholipase family protein [Candidatus Melainabacteria bacterium]|nr:patatin-like phospholipase family protein [Candidatus Melainabacteria bacterium]
MQTFNLVLSGGGVRSYAHLGVYKYCFENEIKFNEIIAVSGGSLIAPFIFLRKDPKDVINLFKEEKMHKKLFPFWFISDKFEFLFTEPTTIKIGEWIEKQFTKNELKEIELVSKLHIMATKSPRCGIKAMYTDMLKITDLKNSIAASCAISGIFKEHEVGNCTYIDGGHWNSCPIFFNFQDNFLSLLAISLGYVGLKENEGGKISKIIQGFEILSFARVQEDINRWKFEKDCKQRGDLFVINPAVWNVSSLDFNLKNWQIDEIINAGYLAARRILSEYKGASSNKNALI